MNLIATQILNFYNNLAHDHPPKEKNIEVLNPFRKSPENHVLKIIDVFYHKYYSDNKKRKLILGINPGRLGAGATGIPFTDTKRLNKNCKIKFEKFSLHEPSSVFIYEMIEAFGGPKNFYRQYYISSVCPIGFATKNKKGNLVNFNYYDDPKFAKKITPYILRKLKEQLAFGLDAEVVYCLGSGKNFNFLKRFNDEYKLFGEIAPLDHPRYIVQYKSKSMQEYINRYLKALGSNK